MKYKVITKNQGKVVIDTTQVTDTNVWVVNDLDFDEPIIFKTDEDFFHTGLEAVKILYTVNFSIDKDIPMIIVEDKVKKSLEKHYSDGTVDERIAFLLGCKSTQKDGYSEDALAKCITFGWELYHYHKDKEPHVLLKMQTNYIQSLKQEYIELEMEQLNNKPSSSYSTETIYKLKTTRDENGQLIAYQKLTV
jgi:hypothetical protein